MDSNKTNLSEKQQELTEAESEAMWSNPLFSRFWSQYFVSQEWSRKHWLVSDNLRSQCNDWLPIVPPPPPPPLPCCHHRKTYEKEDTVDETGSDVSKEEVDVEEDEIMNVDEEQIEIDDDFVEFLSKSIKHRIERDKEKNISGAQNSWVATLDEYIPVDKIGVNRRVVGFAESLLAPTEDQGQQRMREMKVLYGNNFERIQALESLMQVQFDMEFDKLNPPLWPNMPFKL